MPNDKKFNAVDTIQHRYSEPEVLKQELLALGFKENQIKWQVCRTYGLHYEFLLLHQLERAQSGCAPSYASL